MNRLILQIIAGILGLWLANKFVPGVSLEIIPDQFFFGIELTASWQILILTGAILGLVNFFLKPIFKIIALPFRILTLGLFTLVINMGMIWVVDVLFLELKILGLIPLFWTTMIIWGLSFLLGIYRPKRRIVAKE